MAQACDPSYPIDEAEGLGLRMGQAIQQDQVSKSEVKGGEGMGHGGRLIVWEGWGPRFALQASLKRSKVESSGEPRGTHNFNR